MDKFNSAVRQFDDKARGVLSYVDNNEYVTAAITLFLIVYASYAAPKLPPYILKLFDNTLFKLLIFFFIVYTFKKNPTVALVTAIAFLVTIIALNKLKLDTAISRFLYKETEGMHGKLNMDDQELMDISMMEDMVTPEMTVSEDAVVEIQEEVKSRPGCKMTANYRNSFYPQYANMKPDAYKARYSGNEVSGFDSDAAYASI